MAPNRTSHQTLSPSISLTRDASASSSPAFSCADEAPVLDLDVALATSSSESSSQASRIFASSSFCLSSFFLSTRLAFFFALLDMADVSFPKLVEAPLGLELPDARASRLRPPDEAAAGRPPRVLRASDDGATHPRMCPLGSAFFSPCCCRLPRNRLWSSCGVNPGLILISFRTLYADKEVRMW